MPEPSRTGAPARRSSGVLLHVTSLPGGRLGDDAYAFVDWLAAAGQRWWQVLPLGPPDAFGSPYTSASAFAGWRGLLADPEAEVTERELEEFRRRHAFWVGDWERYAGAGTAEDQARFEREWAALRRYAGRRGIGLIGDLPIYVAGESADVAAHPELFAAGLVAGAAPDAAHPEGQLWGQPVYDWAASRRTGDRWWIERFRHTFELFDLARLDHFRGYVAAWAVPASAASPLEGHWRRGPGEALFRAVETELGGLPLIAEDLGYITPAVDALRARLRIPGMRIVVRSFTRRHRRRHAVSAHPKDTVVYTGTHDHQPLAGWWASAPPPDRRAALRDLAEAGIDAGDPAWALVRLTLASPAGLSILQMQDVLGLGDEARMNEPGTTSKRNWAWRLERGQLTDELAGRLHAATRASGRAAAAARRPRELAGSVAA